MADSVKVKIIMSTIAVLIAPNQPARTVAQDELQKVLSRPIGIGQSPEGMLITSQRDQIEAVAGGNKINVRDLSGSRVFARSKIPPVLHFLLGTPLPQITSYGVNFIIDVPCARPLDWVRDNILSSQISEKTGKTLMGGAGVITVAAGSKTWNIKFQPTQNKAINIDFNASEQTQQVPNQGRLREELLEQFNALLELLNNFGL